MRKKRILITRLGGYGDDLMATPLIRFLDEIDQDVCVLTQKPQGQDIFTNNPHIREIRYHARDSVPNSSLLKYLEKYRLDEGFDEAVQLNESLEVRLALHPEDPAYSWSKQERISLCNRNYYEEVFKIAVEQLRDKKLRHKVERAISDNPPGLYLTDMFFTDGERDSLADFRAKRLQFGSVLVWALAGSGIHKSYPYADYVMHDMLESHPELLICTIGGAECQILERSLRHDRLIRLSGRLSFRQSALIAREYCDVIVSPDTGILHAAGGGSAATIGLFGHCTKEQSTKHFRNDYSLEAVAECAPCMRLIFQPDTQCPVDPITRGAWCMSQGISYERVKDAIESAMSFVPSSL